MVNVAVIGAGYLGTFHIEKISKISDCRLAGVVDVDPQLRAKVKERFGVPVFADYRELADAADAVSVVVPTPLHHEVAKFFIERGIHTFIEKPVTATLDECRDLMSALRPGTKVQVGHIERFNPVYRHIRERLESPKAMFFRRKAPFIARGSDVDVVFDVMIHDIDIALSLLAPHQPTDIEARGIAVVTERNDHLAASFHMGETLVTLEASRLGQMKERAVTVLDRVRTIEGNFITQQVFERDAAGERNTEPAGADILLEELRSFVNAVRCDLPVQVSVQDGYSALSAASGILRAAGGGRA